jgi:hypothetical protein
MSKKTAVDSLAWNERHGINSVPVLQIRDRSVVMYYELLRGHGRLNNKKTWQAKDLNKTAYSGRVTQGVRKRMTRALNIMLMTVKPKTMTNPVNGRLIHHKLSFITLKISNPEKITGREAYDKCFSHFLDWMSKTKKVKLYVWKLEMEKSKKIHYHVTVPDFIHYEEIRDTWNDLQRKAGFLAEYAAEHGHYKANSTDIHEVMNVRDLASYIIKAFADSLAKAERLKQRQQGKKVDKDIGAEFGKDVQNEEAANSKIWGCCELLSASKYPTFLMEIHHEQMIEKLRASEQVREVKDDTGRWCVWYFNDSSPPEMLAPAENLYVASWLKWQMSKPLKGADEQEVVSWASRKPFLN